MEGQLPTGRPSVEVSIVLELDDTTLGTSARGKNHTLKVDVSVNFPILKLFIRK